MKKIYYPCLAIRCEAHALRPRIFCKEHSSLVDAKNLARLEKVHADAGSNPIVEPRWLAMLARIQAALAHRDGYLMSYQSKLDEANEFEKQIDQGLLR